jgi:hypothetical protein
MHLGLGSGQGQQLDFGSYRHSAPAIGLDVEKAHHIVGCVSLSMLTHQTKVGRLTAIRLVNVSR